MKFLWGMQYVTGKKWLDFGGDLAHVMLGLHLPWQKFVLWMLLFENH